jgi:hypothetical protein
MWVCRLFRQLITAVLRGLWDNSAFDVLCHLEEDLQENRDWRRSLYIGGLMAHLDKVSTQNIIRAP